MEQLSSVPGMLVCLQLYMYYVLEVTSSKVIVNSGNEAEIRTRQLSKHFLAKLVIMVSITQVFPTYVTTCDVQCYHITHP